MMMYGSQIMKSFSKQLAYRAEVWLQIGGNILLLFIQISLWSALLGSSVVSGIGIGEMVTYAIVNTALSIIMMTNVHNDVDETLKSGSIIMQLVKPLRYPLMLFADQAGANLYRFVFQLVPTLAVAALLFGVRALQPEGPVVWFLITVVIALLISFGLGYLVALIAFWFLTTFALRWTLGGLLKVFSGTYIPLWFFPSGWYDAASLLPFKFLGFVPAAMYMGRFTTSEIYENIATGLLWIVILYGLLFFLWRRAMRRLVIQGG